MTVKHNFIKIYRNKKRFLEFIHNNGPEKVKQIAIDYSKVWENGNYVSIGFLSKKYGVHKSIIQDSIAYSIVYSLISMDTAQAIKEKSHKKQAKYSHSNKTNKNDYYYNRLFKIRKELQANSEISDESEDTIDDNFKKLEILEQQIYYLKLQIRDFDNYISSEDENFLKKSDLEKKLEELERELSNLT